ncbi:RDD family protein [Amycolatopsis sp. YIM 10]|uniref:RDD family protein n=1 Tax=Amycolatopsis sp. YIM 10 TaxID=2653857 RepID=UPI00128FFD5D|nr:RDD family protein [Amycolatopsis sp. YIM 10]QFU93543.1 RDD family protein [Amycolatopsis sp. YIM 10]
MSELVTGEAVVLRLRVAAVPTRCLAFLIDVLLQAAVLVTLLMVAGVALAASVDEALFLTVSLAVVVLTLVGYPVLMETLAGGRTLGKMALGLRVVRDDGGPIRFRHALTRGLAGFFVDFWALGLAGAVALVVAFLSGKGKRVGDYLAGTVVIAERTPEAVAPLIMMPPGCEAWAAQLDLARLPDAAALDARQYLGRWREFSEDAQAQLGFQISREIADAIGTPVPPGMPYWTFLSAVLAERRRRDHAQAWQRHQPPPGPGWGPPPPSGPPAGEQPFAPPS